MSLTDLFICIGVPGLLLALLRITQRSMQRFRLTPELARKILHIAMGLLVLSLPWLIHAQVAVLMLSVCTIMLLIMLREYPRMRSAFGAPLHSVMRNSHGEIYFVLGALVTFIFAGDNWPQYCAAIMVLTFADAAAALVGTHFGHWSFSICGQRKTLEGCLSFWATSLIVVFAALLLCSPAPLPTALYFAVSVAFTCTLVEAVSVKGLDNFLIPATALLALNFPQPLLALALPITCGLLLLTTRVTIYEHSSTLDGNGC